MVNPYFSSMGLIGGLSKVHMPSSAKIRLHKKKIIPVLKIFLKKERIHFLLYVL